MYTLHKTAHATFDDFSFEFFTRLKPVNAATKCVQKCVQQDKNFYLKIATASVIMSGDLLAMETIYNCI